MTTAVDSSEISLPDLAKQEDSLRGPLFILSVWRSGSSLLYALLNRHSKIALLYEGDLPRLHRFLFGRFRNGTWRERWNFWNQGPSRHGIAVESMPASVANAWEATRLVYQGLARRKQATIWGEKTPHWYDCPLQMAEHFPDARFIFLWRDMGAVMESIRRAALTERFFKKAGFANRVFIGNEKLKRACDVLEKRGRPVHELNYEDLTSNTSDCMRQICAFLDVPFESRLTSLEGADRSAIGSGEHHEMVRSDRVINRGRRDHVLSPAQQAKAARYICHWKRHYEGKWPKYPLELPEHTRPPSLIELGYDRVIYQAVQCRDKLVAVIYAIVPIGLARRLRSWLHTRGGAHIPLPTLH
jgi:Sulfotransferase family